MRKLIDQFFSEKNRNNLFILTASLLVMLLISKATIGFTTIPILSDGELNTLKLIVQILGGGVLIVGLFLNNKRIKVTDDGNVNERFKNAIEHLGSDKVPIRLGAIYELHRIAKDSPKDRESIQNILCSYIRDFHGVKGNKNQLQSIVDLLTKSKTYNSTLINFSGASFIDIDLSQSNLHKANLSHTNFIEVDFKYANMSNADLEMARIQKANFQNANLKKASLEKAHLSESVFKYTNLEEANLKYANLIKPNFEEANLKKAILKFTYLKQAWLRHACIASTDLSTVLFDNPNISKEEIKKDEETYSTLIIAKTLHSTSGIKLSILNKLKANKPELFEKPKP